MSIALGGGESDGGGGSNSCVLVSVSVYIRSFELHLILVRYPLYYRTVSTSEISLIYLIKEKRYENYNKDY